MLPVSARKRPQSAPATCHLCENSVARGAPFSVEGAYIHWVINEEEPMKVGPDAYYKYMIQVVPKGGCTRDLTGPYHCGRGPETPTESFTTDNRDYTVEKVLRADN